MAEKKITQKIEREYVIPLRRHWVNVPQYKRARKAVLTIKRFVAKHMKVINRNLDNVKLDVYLNNEVWYRGKTNPPSKIKVKVIKEGDIVRVKFAETPQYVAFLKIKHSKLHKKAEEKKTDSKSDVKTEVKTETKTEQKPETKTEEQKIDEKEKGKAVEQQNIKQADAQQKAQKHTSKVKEQKIHRMALKK